MNAPTSSGNVGTRYAGYFVGDVIVTGTVTELSDARVKQDIRPVEGGVVARLGRLGARQYRFREHVDGVATGADAREHYGFIAGEVAEVFPELVREIATVRRAEVDAQGRMTAAREGTAPTY